MHIGLIMDNPETPRHPVIGTALQKLKATHHIRLLDVSALTGSQAIAQEYMHPLAELYLLKSHAAQALVLAQRLEQDGALVVNSWASSVACQNRATMSQLLNEAHLPWPRTQIFSSLAFLLQQSPFLSTLSFPVIIKSHNSYRGDLVTKVHSLIELQALVPRWNQEPVILQEYVAGDGWDMKLWVINQQIFAARRRTPLAPGQPQEDIPLSPEQLPVEWLQIALRIGEVFNMRLYGVDLLSTEQGPIIVDVNSFPGFRRVRDADSALVAMVEQLEKERRTTA